ncbi:MAG TPA: cyclic peptide export ABC transporter [Candidatus Angelobacter sp.]|nr:cyclic peptide export ABC transporter [Candidatus Angelobacter sp.]
MKIILFFLKHSRKALVWSVIAGVASGVCNAAMLAIINRTLKTDHPGFALIAAFAGLCLLLPLTRFSSESLLARLGQAAMYESRMKLCRQVLAAPLRHLERIGTARLLATLTDDIPNITGALNVLPVLCVNAALVVGCLVFMATLSWPLFLFVMVFLVLGIASYQLPIIKVHRIFTASRKDADALLGHFRALTGGTKELKIHRSRRQAFLNQELEKTASSLMENNISALKTYAGAASWGQTLVFAVIGLYLFLFPRISHPSNAALMGYTLALLYLMTPLQVIMNTLPQLSRASIALKTVTDLGFTLAKEEPEDQKEPLPPLSQWQKLELKSVSHAYSGENECESFVLGPLDLRFKSGELVFVTGGNGSGKTTLVKLIAGLYTAEKGHLYLDGKLIDDHNLEWYRQHFSVVFSDFFLFEQLLGFAEEDIENRAEGYLKALKLTEKVRITGQKLSTTDLSQGQRKRLALLTAYLEDRSIYVFDEWAADQDPYFKNIFYMQLLPELKRRGKTVLVISHDDRYYGVADRIIKLEEGQVVTVTAGSPNSFEMASGYTV